jgi:subtilase family serine protease
LPRTLFAIPIIVLLLSSSSLAANGAFASQSSPQTDTHHDEINGPGGLMSLTGIPIQSQNPSNPLQIKEHHPAHIKKFIGPKQGVALSGGDAPATIWTAYGFNGLGCTQTTTNLCGSGQTIAIVDAYNDPNIASDLQTFDSQFSLPACTVVNGCLTVDTPQGTPATDSGWAMEISLDVEWAHAIAPGAKIVLVEASSNSLGNLLSGVSYAVGTGAKQVSNSWGSSEFSTESSYDSYYNSPTTSFFVSSGDGGHGVEWPAASPYVVSVGGTTLTTSSTGAWESETAWADSGGGISAYEKEPSYQTNFNINTNGYRAVPDVAYDGNPSTGVYVYDSVPIDGESGWWIVGGTSAGAPQWAAISAIANSQNANLASASFGTSNALYGAASGAPSGTPYASNYHDITSGSNGNCGSVCDAGPGYDEVTGLGSPQANNLVPYISPSPTPNFVISASPSSLTLNFGSYNSSTITVTSVNDFSGIVSLVSSPSSGATLSPSSVTVPASGSVTATLTMTPAASTTYTITGTSGTLTHSTTVTATVPTVPSAPQNLVATAGNAQVTLTWDAPSSNGGSAVTGYDIYRNGTEIATNIAPTSYTDTGLTNGDTDTYQVTAVNAVDQSPLSTSASATPVATPTLHVLVTTDKTTYPQRSTADITITVTSSSTPVSGASVTVTVKTSTGGTAQGTGTTNSHGQVTFSYSISRNAPTGTYTASATAAKSGYISGSGSTTFSVT